MKVNKWTLGLAAAGLVSIPLMVTAEEKATSPVMTQLSSTTISGYVDTSMHWNPGTGDANPAPYIYNTQSKQDGFNLDKVKIRIDKPLTEENWAAGYRFDALFGPDANTFASTSTGLNTSDFGIQNAYVALRAPVLANGLDFKVGVFDSVIGYESHDSVNDPNYTRSYGTTIEPHTHTGVLATYNACNWLGVSAGIANTVGPQINYRAFQGSVGGRGGTISFGNVVPGSNAKAESYKSYMGSVALTAPDSMGFLQGSTLYAGIVNGFDPSLLGSGAGVDQLNFYAGATLATPIKGVKIGASFDYLDVKDGLHTVGNGTTGQVNADSWSVAGYASFAATEKLSFHARAEYFQPKFSTVFAGVETPVSGKIFALTGTIQYDLWKNVMSRLEVRWDHSASGRDLFGGEVVGQPDKKNDWLIAANIIYKF